MTVWEFFGYTQKDTTNERIPIVYKHDCAKAVIVDIGSFEKIEMILDNLVNRESEDEDKLLAASGLLKELLNEAQTASPSQNWRAALDEL